MFGPKIMMFGQQIMIFDPTNHDFWSKIMIFGPKIMMFDLKSLFLFQNHRSLTKNQEFDQNPDFWTKVMIFDKKLISGQKSWIVNHKSLCFNNKPIKNHGFRICIKSPYRSLWAFLRDIIFINNLLLKGSTLWSFAGLNTPCFFFDIGDFAGLATAPRAYGQQTPRAKRLEPTDNKSWLLVKNLDFWFKNHDFWFNNQEFEQKLIIFWFKNHDFWSNILIFDQKYWLLDQRSWFLDRKSWFLNQQSRFVVQKSRLLVQTSRGLVQQIKMLVQKSWFVVRKSWLQKDPHARRPRGGGIIPN